MPRLPASCFGAVSLVALLSASAATPPELPTVHPALWPSPKSPVGLDRTIEGKVDALLATMTVEEKVGQVIQPEWKTITPADVITYHIGSIENGGGAVPGGNKHASVQDWVNLIDPYWQASVDARNHVRIPLVWVSDAVHGHNNVFGATLFPHNVGLGAAHDPGLIRRIGEMTAAEVRSTGMDWSFSPTIAVARDDRWGRTYESYSEDPKIVSEYAAAMIKGLQGEGRTFLDKEHVLATAKHFLGDGSTDGGRDQGDSTVSEAELARLHGAAYGAAISAGVQSIMASYNSWHGTRMHASKALLTDILKGRMGFDGILTGDWLAHGQIPGCTNSDCPAAFNAGLDIFNQPLDWKQMHASLVREVGDGTIPMARLDDAVRRILRVKFRMGAFDAVAPKDRATTLRPIGTPAHRAVAREAVAKSLVLLKNNDKVLPLKPGAVVLVAGDGANNIAMQAGGWTLSWQGADNGPQDFPGATSILDGLKAQLEAGGGKALLAPDGRFTSRPDVAVVVFGENPYAEFMGDQADVALHHDNEESLAILKRLKAAGIPTVAVLLSGRPLYVNPQINAADAFVAAWLPGSEGEGIADVLTGKRDFTGRLAFSWPRRPDQTPLNVGDAHYDPQFPYGYGLSYASRVRTPVLAEVATTMKYGEKNVYLTGNDLWNGYSLSFGGSNTPRIAYAGTRATLQGPAALAVEPGHEGVHASWAGRDEAWLEVAADAPSDIAREANGAMMLSVRMKVNAAPVAVVTMGVGVARLDVTSRLVPGETTLAFPLSCFKAQDLARTPSVLRLATAGALDITLEDVRLTETRPGAACPG
jgi:beta-glucosidase